MRVSGVDQLTLALGGGAGGVIAAVGVEQGLLVAALASTEGVEATGHIALTGGGFVGQHRMQADRRLAGNGCIASATR